MRPILLATDGSPSAAEATLEAIELAKALDAPLVVASVSHVTVPAYGYYGYSDVVSQLTRADDEHVQKVLAETLEAASAAGVACDTVAGKGPVVEEICKIARGRKARLVVVGAHGWRPLRRMVSGSVSMGVMHEAPCPVLVVRGGSELLADEPVVVEKASVSSPPHV
jgi:nucleotide-binding universal stress UspA family protein